MNIQGGGGEINLLKQCTALQCMLEVTLLTNGTGVPFFTC
jgi:hypothetical protein